MSVQPTPYSELNTVLSELVSGIKAALGSSFVGAYLQGSFAVGDFDRHSDVDFVIAVEGVISEGQVDSLQLVHGRIYDFESEWTKHLEGSYFPRAVLRNYDQSGTRLWYLEHGDRQLVKSNHCNTIVVRWVLREKGVVLSGPVPATLIHPIPAAALRQEIFETMNNWGNEILSDPTIIGSRFYQTFAVLSYCRMLHDFSVGTVGSKRSGAEWAKAALDPRWADLIDRAWEGRPNPALSSQQPANPADLERTLEFIKELLRRAYDLSNKLGFGLQGDLHLA